MKKIIETTSLVLLLLTFFSSCQKEKVASNAKTFNLSKFKENLKTQITLSSGVNTPQGYSFVINKDGQVADSFSFGIAYKSAAGGAGVPWSTNQEINIASVTKTLTAVAVYQLLKKNNLKITDSIGPWLPTYFNAKPAVKNISFGELMSHSSGLLESNTSYDSIKATLSRGLDDPTKKADQYANINFAIFRIIIPYLVNKNSAASMEGFFLPLNPDGFEKWMSQGYQNYMQTNVFSPIGLGTVNCIPSANTAQAFSEPAGPSQAVGILNDWTETSGGGGFYMSVLEIARFMAYVSQTSVLLDIDQKLIMDSKYMGWDNEDSPMTYAGRAYGKDGALRWDSNNNGTAPDPGDAGLQTLIMKFPNKVELSLAINSLPGGWRGTTNLVKSAYDGAWE